MKTLGLFPQRWLARHSAAIGTLVIALGLAAGAGCAEQSSTGVGSGTTASGTGGMTTSSSTSSTSGTSSTNSSSSSGETTSSTSSSSTSVGSSSGGGAGGATGTGGAGGEGGSFMRPTGTAEYPAETEPNNIQAQANLLPTGALGFTASIWPLGDVDYFEVDPPTGGATLSVSTSDGMGNCPPSIQTYVRIEDDMGNVLALDPGTNGCASLTPDDNPDLTGLAAGKYYVHVESPNLTIVPSYVVAIDLQLPVCGDGIVQVSAGEQCDDGAANGTMGDPCSATCQLTTGDYADEIEPNDTPMTAQNLAGYAGVVGQLNPAGDTDYYEVAVTVPGSSITAVISNGEGGCPTVNDPTGFDPQLQLLSPTGTVLVTDDTSGVAPCSAIKPAKYSAAANLPVGKYMLNVSSISGQVLPYYVLSVTVEPAGCGDGIVQPPEQCDPGPVMVPGCSSTCMFTADYIDETEPNDTAATANPLGTHAGFVGAIQPIGDVDYYSFAVPGPSSLVFLQTSDGIGGCPPNFSSLLTFYGPTPTVAQLAQNAGGGVGTCSLISPDSYPAAMNLAAGTYYARVEYKGDMNTCPEYVLTVSVRQPGCGDGILEAGEQCDDGPNNGTAGDGCSATCTSLPPWEIEPNNTIAQATPQWSGFSTWKGAIRPVGDHDYYSFTLTTAGMVTLVTHDIDEPNTCTSDTFLTLDDSSGTEITFDDDSGPGPGDPSDGGKCAKISNQMLAAGTYYAWVQRYGDSKVIPGYQLDLQVQ